MGLSLTLSVEVDTGAPEPHWVSLYEGNITHNLSRMADLAGIYEIVWWPEKEGIEIAADIIAPLAAGISKMKADPDQFKRENPPNGWGDYDAFVEFLEKYLAACRCHPKAYIGASK